MSPTSYLWEAHNEDGNSDSSGICSVSTTANISMHSTCSSMTSTDLWSNTVSVNTDQYTLTLTLYSILGSLAAGSNSVRLRQLYNHGPKSCHFQSAGLASEIWGVEPWKKPFPRWSKRYRYTSYLFVQYTCFNISFSRSVLTYHSFSYSLSGPMLT